METDVLGAVVPIQQFLIRTSNVVVALEHAVAFPEGCRLVLHLAARRGDADDTTWDRVANLDPGWSTGDPRFGVRESGGTVRLAEAGSESSSGRASFYRRQELWLGPLPPPEPFEVVVSWPDLGIREATATVDGAAIVRAAPSATPFWSS